MDNSQMPKDGSFEAIPVLGYKKAGSQTVTSNVGGTARNTEAFTMPVATVVTDVPVRMAQGRDDTVTALTTDAYLPAGSHDISLLKGGVHFPYIAFRTVSSAATVIVNERE